MHVNCVLFLLLRLTALSQGSKLHPERSISARGAALITGNQLRESALCLGPVAICPTSQDASVVCGPLERPFDVQNGRADWNDARG